MCGIAQPMIINVKTNRIRKRRIEKRDLLESLELSMTLVLGYLPRRPRRCDPWARSEAKAGGWPRMSHLRTRRIHMEGQGQHG